MDETKQTSQGSPQSEEAGLSSGGEGGITSPAEKLIPESEYRKLQVKAFSDVKAADGRWRQTMVEKDALQKGLDSAVSRLEALEDRARESELETVRGDPALLRLHQEKEVLTKEVRELRKGRQEVEILRARFAAIEAETQETKKGSLISQVASKVTPEKLEKLKGLSLEALETVVDIIGKGAASTATPSGPEFTPDSAISSGGVGEITPEWAERASMEEYAARRKKQDPTLL